MSGIRIRIDDARRTRESLLIRGWAAADEEVRIRVTDRRGRDIPAIVERHRRRDIETYLGLTGVRRDSGFLIEVKPLPQVPVCVHFSSGTQEVTEVFHASGAGALADAAGRKAKNALGFLARNGAAAFYRKSKGKLTHTETKAEPYPVWIVRHLPGEEELERQRNDTAVLPRPGVLHIRDRNTAQDAAERTGYALAAQTAPPAEEKELLLPAGGTADLPETMYTVLVKEGDMPVPSALYEIAKEIGNGSGTGLFYTDDDRVNESGRFSDPRMKPEFAPDYYYAYPYVGTFLAVRTGLLAEVIGECGSEESTEAFFYALVLRCFERQETIRRIPRVLIHRTGEEKLAFADHKRIAEEHFARMHFPVYLTEGSAPGTAGAHWRWEEEPLVSVLIPNKDHHADLDKCVRSLLAKNTYPRLEVLIIENNSTEEETFREYETLRALDDRIRILRYEGGFNFSAINNLGAGEAKGEVLFLLNNDTEFITDVIPEMLGFALRKDVGAVGALLYYPDDTVQHAGIVLGWGGACGHAFPGKKRGDPGYMNRIEAQQDLSAVTAAAVMLRREVYESVGCLDEAFAVALNDMDLCMKIRTAGYRIVYDPCAQLYHYESKSRGSDDTREKRLLWEKEYDLFLDRWEETIAKGDPYYSPNLSLTAQDYSLRPFTLE